VADGQLSLIPERRHSHLRLAGAVSPGPRRPRQPAFRGQVHYQDRASHGRAIRADATRVRTEHAARKPVLGIDPELILVLEANGRLAPEEVERAGLTVLELRSDKALVAFASDPEMKEFLRRNTEYQRGSPGVTEKGNERAAAYQGLFDALDTVRRVSADDVLSRSLAEKADAAEPGQLLRVDIECWCGEDEPEARRRNADICQAVGKAGGQVLGSGVRVEAGWSTVCAHVPAGFVRELAGLDRIRRVDSAPQPLLSHPQVWAAGPTDLPLVIAPPTGAPIVAVIDSGVRSAHPLLAPAATAVEYVGPGLGDGGDDSGHGTLVASLALYGSLEESLANHTPLQAAGRLASIRVLGGDGLFSDTSWVKQLLEALELAAEVGASVINLSVGDPRNPYLPPRPTPVAALIDLFVREHPGIVVVISAGNYSPYAHPIETLVDGSYPQTLLEGEDAGLLDPAPAALALTVGALCADEGQGSASPQSARGLSDMKAAGHPGLPSPLTRVGPGPGGMVKPELCAPGGSVTVDTLQGRPTEKSPATGVIGAGGKDQNRLLVYDAGTSFAAPLVSHAALRVFARYPDLSGNAVRALLLLSVEPVDLIVEGGRPSDNDQQQRRLTGYGRVSSARAETSTDHRAVLVSEGEIRLDDVHLYVVPLPATFFDAGGESSVSIALAYDPPVRVTRLDYLASRMGVTVYHGAAFDDVKRAYVLAEENEELDDDADATPSSLDKFKLAMQPADSNRGRGAHHYGSYTRYRRFEANHGSDLVIAVRSVNRWDTPGAEQGYALAVALERDADHAELYSELHVRLEALAEVEVEQEIEL